MNWRLWKRKPVDAIPNPRDNKRRRDARIEEVKHDILLVAQFLCFAVAWLILIKVTNGR